MLTEAIAGLGIYITGLQRTIRRSQTQNGPRHVTEKESKIEKKEEIKRER
jgi:hypothetical protein